jgi:hypothetical protein
MPRRPSTVGFLYYQTYRCPCGFTRICSDKKTADNFRNRHKRYCEEGAKIEKGQPFRIELEINADASNPKTQN